MGLRSARVRWESITNRPTTVGDLGLTDFDEAVQAVSDGIGVGDVGSYAFCRAGVTFEPGQIVSGSAMHYTGGLVETVARPVPAGSQWMALGWVAARDRGTLFKRVS